jgi:SAM-dependent methyltransferase
MNSNLPGFFQGTEMPTAGWWQALWPDPTGVLAAVGVQPGMDAVDLCCGDGWFAWQVAKIARHVIAIDIDRALLELARIHLAETGAPNCAFHVGDAYQIEYEVHRALHKRSNGAPDRPRLAHASREVLKPGGRLAIVNWHPRRREETTVLGEPRGPDTALRLSPEQTVEAAVSGGLTSVGLVEIPPYHYGALFARPAP